MPQGATAELSVDEAVVDDEIARKLLDEVAQARVPSFRFIGERYRGDGTISRFVMDDCVPTGTFTIAGITSGSTSTRSLTFRVGRAPRSEGLFTAAAA